MPKSIDILYTNETKIINTYKKTLNTLVSKTSTVLNFHSYVWEFFQTPLFKTLLLHCIQ